MKPVLFLLASAVFLAVCSLLGLALAEIRCASAAGAIDQAFALARTGQPGERVEVFLDLPPDRVEVVVRSSLRGELSRRALDRRLAYSVPTGPTSFRNGAAAEGRGDWLCMNLFTGSVWAVRPEGGTRGGSRLWEFLWEFVTSGVP